MAIQFVDFPIKNGDFHSYVSLPEGTLCSPIKLWVNFITTEPCPPEPWNSWLGFRESSPSMAELFRLVKYYNLPRIMSSPHSHLSEFQSKHSAAFYVLSPYNSGIDHSVSHCVMRFLEMFYQHHSVIVEIKHDTVIEHLVDGVFFFPFLRVDMDINRIRIRRVPLRLDCHDVNVGYFC